MRWMLCVLFINGVASANVIEHATPYEYYRVNHKSGQSLLEAMNEATTIIEDGKKFHGKANWDAGGI